MLYTIEKGLIMNKVQKVPFYRLLSIEHQFELLFFDAQGINFQKRTITGLKVREGQWLEGTFSFPRAIYNRCYPGSPELIQRLRDYLGSESIFNIKTQLDKWEVYYSLQKSEVGKYLPRTHLFTPETLAKLIDEEGELFLKPRLGFGGAKVYLITRVSNEQITFRSHWDLPIPLMGKQLYVPLLLFFAPPSIFIAQQKIHSLSSSSRKFDIRILLQKNHMGEWVIAGELSRVTKTRTFLTNDFIDIVPPGTLVSKSLLALVRSISYQVAEQLEQDLTCLGEVGVDFLIDPNRRPWILEVNGKPDKSLFYKLSDPKTLKQIYLNPVGYLDFISRNTQD